VTALAERLQGGIQRTRAVGAASATEVFPEIALELEHVAEIVKAVVDQLNESRFIPIPALSETLPSQWPSAKEACAKLCRTSLDGGPGGTFAIGRPILSKNLVRDVVVTIRIDALSFSTFRNACLAPPGTSKTSPT
jgi:hypothetical protein